MPTSPASCHGCLHLIPEQETPVSVPSDTAMRLYCAACSAHFQGNPPAVLDPKDQIQLMLRAMFARKRK